MAQTQHKDCTINLRTHSSQRALIDKAAEMLHRKRTDFILDVAYREAENVLLDQRLFLVEKADFEKFNELLDSTIENNKN